MFRTNSSFFLVCDFSSEYGQVVDKVPGTDEVFTLARYKDFLGKAYLKVVLFICEEDDYIASK